MNAPTKTGTGALKAVATEGKSMKPIDQIRQLYFNTTKATVQRDLATAVALLKTLPTEEDRQKAAVYMDGLSQMRSEWAAGRPRRGPSARKSRRSRG